MDLNSLLKAPRGTPSPLREAYEAVADAVFVAGTLRRDAARSQTAETFFSDSRDTAAAPVLREAPAAAALASARRRAYARLEDAVIWLQSNAPDLFTALHATLEAIEPINHACADVLIAYGVGAGGHLGLGFRECTAYPSHPRFNRDVGAFLAGWPEIDEKALLERIRQMTALAARGALAAPALTGPRQDTLPAPTGGTAGAPPAADQPPSPDLIGAARAADSTASEPPRDIRADTRKKVRIYKPRNLPELTALGRWLEKATNRNKTQKEATLEFVEKRHENIENPAKLQKKVAHLLKQLRRLRRNGKLVSSADT